MSVFLMNHQSGLHHISEGYACNFLALKHLKKVSDSFSPYCRDKAKH